MKALATLLFPAFFLFTQSSLAEYGNQGKPLNQPKYEQVGTYTFYGLHPVEQCENFKEDSGLCSSFWSKYKCGPCETTRDGTETYLDIFRKLGSFYK